ncbi:hypothetical protein [Novosphingobium sp. PhB57]|nr:hypothetical protein [Novosphingobium sp. PhB57]
MKLPEVVERFGALILFGAQLSSEFDTTRQSPPGAVYLPPVDWVCRWLLR